jgi:4-amino-4-deoxy-L-arabinose transferase-like glycosyltransferase
MIVLAWFVLHIGCLFTPGLLDDVDSIYIEIARQMLLRHDYITPYIDGIRFFDKPPLLYWLAAGSMRLFGAHDWAARLPLALLTLALLLAVYALGLRLFAAVSPATHPDRGALYSALALATSIGPFLYTRFFIPDILICLWMTLAVHAFLIALDRIHATQQFTAHSSQLLAVQKNCVIDEEKSGVILSKTPRNNEAVILSGARSAQSKDPDELSPPTTARTFLPSNSSLLPCLIFAAVTAINLLTKGIIGVIFPIAFVLLYLALTRQLHLLLKLHLIPSTLVFLLIAAPWHILAALRNPAIAMPSGLGLPARGGWAWFYLYNEHIARFLQRRIPHDYGQVPVLLFWLLAALWLFPWTAFLPAAIARHFRDLRDLEFFSKPKKIVILTLNAVKGKNPRISSLPLSVDETTPTPRDREAALTLLLWAGLVLLFFTFSARQEYYSLPAVPALALMAGGLLARADRDPSSPAARSALAWHRWLLVPLCSLLAAVALFFAITAPHTDPRTDIATLLSQGGNYNLSLAHLFDLTGRAMGRFRAPLTFVALGMIVIGPLSYILRRPRRNGPAHTYAANLTLAAAAVCLLLSMHEGLVRFYPTMGSKGLAQAIVAEQTLHPRPPNQQPDLILIDGELTSGSTLLFYTRQPVHFVNGRVNGAWYGSFWPDAPAVFDDDASLDRLWFGPRRIFLLTYTPAARTASLSPFGPVRTLASAGGKSILTNR